MSVIRSGSSRNSCLGRLLLVSAFSAAGLCLPVSAGAATITVTGTGDTIAVDASVTLREAIASINAGANINADVVAVGVYGTADAIHFAIGTGVQTISVGATDLPALSKPVIIDATTQPGFAGTPLIVLDGLGSNAFSRGLTISGGSSTVRGLVIIRFFDGIELITNGGNTIAGNYIGIDQTGTVARGNTGGGGVVVNTSSSSSINVIGGTTVADRNIISGNAEGIQITGGTRGTLISGNYIGTNAAGTAAVGNGKSIDISGFNGIIGGFTGTTPGGPCTGACNLISGNQIGPVVNPGFGGVLFQGNFIGTNAAGTGALGNAGDGIVLNGSGNNIGDTAVPPTGNVIAFNGGVGVNVLSGKGNNILGNSIFGNAGLGIDLGGDGVTANDPLDADTGANDLQNFPVITSAVIAAGKVTIRGTFPGVANSSFRIELFSNVSCNAGPPNDFGEGQTFLGETLGGTNGNGDGGFTTQPLPVPAGQTVFTATATLLTFPSPFGAPEPNGGIGGPTPFETSEFSPCFPPQIAPTNTPTSTPTPAATSTPTNTPTPVAPTATSTPVRTPVIVPTLSPSMLGLLAAALAAAAFALMRKR